MSSEPWPDRSAPVYDGVADFAPHTTGATERYERVALVGEGGMGRVWLGWDTHLRRNVALKQPLVADPASASLLRHEASIAARLEHPGIVVVHDVVELDGSPMFVMALVRGRSFAEVLRDPSTNADGRSRLLAPFAEACAAVGHAHHAGVVHRDLSPRNILLGDDGRARVVDWGVAAAIGDLRAPHTSGTAGFVAPEQAAGGAPSTASDVWSLGAVLRQIVWGESPGQARAANVAPELVAIIERCAHPDPALRYRDAAALAHDIRAWIEGRRVDAYDMPTWRLWLSLARTWRVPLGVAAIGVLAVVGSIAWGARLQAIEAQRARVAEQHAADEASRARSESQRAREATAIASAALSQSQAERAREALDLGDITTATHAAAESIAVAPNPLARGVQALTLAMPQFDQVASVDLPACARWYPSPDPEVFVCADPLEVSAYSIDGTRLWWREAGVHEVRFVDDFVRIIAGDGTTLEFGLRLGDERFRDPEPAVFANPTSPLRYRMAHPEPLDDGLPASPCEQGVAVGLVDGIHPAVFACNGGGVFQQEGQAWRRWESSHVRALVRVGDAVWAGTTAGQVYQLGADDPGFALREPVLALLEWPGRPWVVAHLLTGAVRVLDPATMDVVMELPRVGASLRFVDARTFDGVVGVEYGRWQIREPLRAWAIRSPHGNAAVDWAPGRDVVAATNGGGELRVTDLVGNHTTTVRISDGVAKSVSFAADGRRLIAAGVHADRLSALTVDDDLTLADDLGVQAFDAEWALKVRRVLFTLHGWLVIPYSQRHWWVVGGQAIAFAPTFGPAHDASMSPDRRHVVTANTAGAALVTPGSDDRLVADSVEAVAVAVSNDEDVAWVTRDRLVIAPHGRDRVVVDHPGRPSDVVFVPQGDMIVTTALDRRVRVFAFDSGTLLAEIPAHRDRAVSAAISSDGAWVASAGWDGLVRIASLAPARAALEALR